MKWFIFYKGEIFLNRNKNGRYSIPQSIKCPVLLTSQTDILEIGNAKACEIDELKEYAKHLELVPLRESFFLITEEDYRLAGKCAELVYWNKNTEYCGHCGAIMQQSSPISKCCTKCGREIWPLLSTAIIVRITRTVKTPDDEILLVHSRNFKRDFQSHVAGFVETGENLEETLRREVMEEVGLKLKNIRYFGSQAWPYPCGLMVAFTAEYESGEIHLQETELTKGKWYAKNNLPKLPDKASIARRMIDAWLQTTE